MPEGRLARTRAVYNADREETDIYAKKLTPKEAIDTINAVIDAIEYGTADQLDVDDLCVAAHNLIIHYNELKEAYEHSEWLRQRQGEVHLR